MSEDPGSDDLGAVTRDLRRIAPAAESDTRPRYYEALAHAMRTEAWEPVRANLVAQRSVLRVLGAAALNAPGRAPGGAPADEIDEAWWAYQRALSGTLAALGDLLVALPPSA